MTAESDGIAWQALADHAVSMGKMTPAQRDAGFASDLEPEAPPPGQRDAQGRFAGAPSAATVPRDTPDMQNIKAMADSLVKHGRLTREQADKMVAADLKSMQTGPIDETASDEDIDGATDAAAADLAAKKLPVDPLGEHELDPVFDRPADASMYKLPPALAEKLGLPDMEAVQKLGWQTRLPLPAFNAIAEMAGRYVVKASPDELLKAPDVKFKLQSLPEAEFKLLTQQTTVQLENRYGAETPKKLEQARRLVSTVMKVNPGLLGLLGTGLGSDFGFCVRMIEHASTLYGKGK